MTRRVHDLGGSRAYRPVRPAAIDRIFDHDWERKVFGMTFATLAQGIYNTDENRYARESMEPSEYLASSYWALWFAALETNLVDKGVVEFDEIDERARAIAGGRFPALPDAPRPELVRDVKDAIFGGVSAARPPAAAARFAVGERVRARTIRLHGHTRLPGYVQGRVGVVARVCGSYVYPDTNAHLRGEHPEHVYTVRFRAGELWGDASEPNVTVAVDAWESYLEPAPAAREEAR